MDMACLPSLVPFGTSAITSTTPTNWPSSHAAASNARRRHRCGILKLPGTRCRKGVSFTSSPTGRASRAESSGRLGSKSFPSIKSPPSTRQPKARAMDRSTIGSACIGITTIASWLKLESSRRMICRSFASTSKLCFRLLLHAKFANCA